VSSGAHDNSVQLRSKIVSETPAGARESLRGFIETDLCKKTDYNVVHKLLGVRRLVGALVGRDFVADAREL
jgi:hypothetical protein